MNMYITIINDVEETLEIPITIKEEDIIDISRIYNINLEPFLPFDDAIELFSQQFDKEIIEYMTEKYYNEILDEHK